MKIIPTSDVVIVQLTEPIIAWAMLVETANGFDVKEPLSDTDLCLEANTYKYIDVIEKNGFSVIEGFRCYETEALAEFVKKQYTRTTNIPAWICPVVLPIGCHIIRNQGVIFSNEFTVYSSLNTMPDGVIA